jgi:hypothetical protein
VDAQPNRDQQALWDVQPAWEHELDRLARPALVMAPPPDVQQAILAAVLQAASQTPQPVVVAPMPAPAERSISLTSYLLLAGVVVAYLAALSWVQGLVGGGDWLPTLAAQLLAASDAMLGPLPVSEPLTLLWLLFQRAPWVALLPLAWLLWERDRASASQAA